MATFDAVFVEPDPFDAQISQPAPFTADIKRLINPFDTTATAPDVLSGKTFYDKDGKKTTGTYSWDFKGFRPELLGNFAYNYEETLADTDFASWTPSTTASVIVASGNAGTFAADLEKYEYLLRWRYTCDFVYNSGTTMKAVPVRECADVWQTIMKRPNTLANIEAENYNGNTCITQLSTPLLVYYNTSGSKTYTFSITYGVYPSPVAATFSNSTSNTPTVTVKYPSISARCNSSYFSTARAAGVDQDESVIKMKGEIWRVEKGAVMRSLYGLVIDIYNNGI